MNNKSKKIKLHIKKGDSVLVVAGNDKKKSGKVLEVDVKRNRVKVEGVNIRVYNTKKTQKDPKGKREKKETFVHLSNVMLLAEENQVTRVGRKQDENGKLRRYAKKTGKFI